MEDANLNAQDIIEKDFSRPLWKSKWFFIGISAFLVMTIVITAVIFNNTNQNRNTNKTEDLTPTVTTTEINATVTNSPTQAQPTIAQYSWIEDGANWKATSSTVPVCSTPLLNLSPVDTTKATSILYPGQTRGGDYKPHGGFRFDKNLNNSVDVKMPLDADLVKGSRYIQDGDVQYLFEFLNACGIAFRLDHLLTLTPTFQSIADTLPQPKVNDSRTTNFEPRKYQFKSGDLVATRIGFEKSNPINVGVDFGVYDYRQRNAASQNQAYVSSHTNNTLAYYAICWLNELPADDAVRVIQLPGGDQVSGKKSDYCK